MLKKPLLLAAAVLVVGVGCKSEIDGKTAATVQEPSSTAAAAPTTAAQNSDAKPASVDFDVTKSKVEWTAGKVTKDEQGGFKTISGKVGYAPDGAVSTIEAEIDTGSVYSSMEKLTNHLKSPDFFDVEKYPTSTFSTTSITKGEGDAYTVTGLLDLRGVKKEISFPATITDDGKTVTANAEFTLKRFDFGIEYKGAADDLIKPDVLMKLTVVAPKPAES